MVAITLKPSARIQQGERLRQAGHEYEGSLEVEESTIGSLCDLAPSLISDVKTLSASSDK